MKKRYRLFRRGRTWWIHDRKPAKGKSCHQSSLKTKDKQGAERLLASLNEPYRFAAYNLQMAKTHLQMSNPEITRRTWQEVMDAVVKTKQGTTRIRYERAAKDKAFDGMRDSVLMETPAEVLFNVMEKGTVAECLALRSCHPICQLLQSPDPHSRSARVCWKGASSRRPARTSRRTPPPS